MELLIVMLILFILMAFLVPIIFNQMKLADVRRTKLQIMEFDRALLDYKTENGDYPHGRADVPRSGLAVLAGEPNPYNPMQSGMQQPGMIGAPGMTGGQVPGMDAGGMPQTMTGSQMGGMGGANPMMSDTMGMGGANPNPVMPGSEMTRGVGTDPSGQMGAGMDGGMMGGMGMNPQGVGGDPLMTPPTVNGVGGAVPGGMGAAPATPGFNPAQGAGATRNYLGKPLGKDRWDNEYFYEYPTNRRPDTSMPAVWSAGPDKISGTDDDIINWEDELNELKKNSTAYAAFLARQQQGGQMGGLTAPGVPGIPNTSDPMGMGGGMGMGGMGMDTMTPNMQGQQNPVPTMPVQPNPMPTMPVQPNPMPTMPVQPNPMPTMPVQPNPMPTNP